MEVALGGVARCVAWELLLAAVGLVARMRARDAARGRM